MCLLHAVCVSILTAGHVCGYTRITSLYLFYNADNSLAAATDQKRTMSASTEESRSGELFSLVRSYIHVNLKSM